MKSAVALLLALVLLVGGMLPHTDGDEVRKIPNLMLHFAQHQREAKHNLGFLAFLRLHYGLGSAHAKSHRTDHSLPAFHHHCSALAFVLPAAMVLPAVVVAPEPVVRPIFYQNAYAYLYAFSFLRPPQPLQF